MPPTVRPSRQVYRKSDGVLMARGWHVKHVGQDWGGPNPNPHPHPHPHPNPTPTPTPHQVGTVRRALGKTSATPGGRPTGDRRAVQALVVVSSQ